MSQVTVFACNIEVNFRLLTEHPSKKQMTVGRKNKWKLQSIISFTVCKATLSRNEFVFCFGLRASSVFLYWYLFVPLFVLSPRRLRCEVKSCCVNGRDVTRGRSCSTCSKATEHHYKLDPLLVCLLGYASVKTAILNSYSKRIVLALMEWYSLLISNRLSGH